MRWLSFSLLAAGLGAGLALKGGVRPEQWNWSIVAVAIAGLVSRMASPRRERFERRLAAQEDSRTTSDFWITGILFALPAWVALQMVPLPQGLVSVLSPMRAEIARGAGTTSWIPLSIAPARTFQLLLNAGAYAVTFLVIRDLTWMWRRRIWLVAVPVIAFAGLEGMLGIYQFYTGRQSGDVLPSHGTWVNPDHFAGFLEMALPLAITGAFAAWRSGILRREQSARAASMAAASLAVAAVCLAAIVVSLSRAGFIAAIVSLAVISLVALLAHAVNSGGMSSGTVSRIPAAGRIAAGLAVLLTCSLVFLFLPTDELILRFGSAVNTQNVSGETRIALWRDTRNLIAAYPVTGSGLGTYESALPRFKTVAPMSTADYAHNDYLQAAAELGIAAAAAGLVWVLLIFARASRAAVSLDAGPNRYLALGLTGSLTAILLHSFVDFNLYIPANAMVFAWICGISASGALRARSSAASTAAVRVIRLKGQPA